MESFAEPAADAACVSVDELTTDHRLYAQLQELRQFYRSQFGALPQFFVRVPGRVNLIGEHVDYCGYPVLPMAIDQCIILAVGCSKADSQLQLRNVHKTRFDDFDCELASIRIELPQHGSPEWYNYYLCGVKGIHELLSAAGVAPMGMKVALHGSIPAAAGLSSSSALVSAAALATAHVHRLPLDRKRLAAISASCERYIGTQGGGMDQAIAYLAKEGCAQFIEFVPELNATPIQLPEGACFIVANSLADINKAASSDFNERVVECRLGARIIAKHMKLADWRDITRFAQLQAALKCSLTQLEDLMLVHLPHSMYTRTQVASQLEVDEQEFEREFLTENTRHMMLFKLRQRALHVIQESLRVDKFRAICQKSASDGHCGALNINCAVPCGDQSQLLTLSQLMRQSHQSLKELYECSHPDLDRLVAISDAAGVGARLTGAGWGGCIVALCGSIESSAKYIRELKDKYFSQLPSHIIDQHRRNDFDDVIFATFPGGGAEIFITN